MPMQIYFICQPYLKAKGGLKPGLAVQAPDAETARQRGHRMFIGGGQIVGVDVVEQAADEDAGDYGEPVFLERLGQVPAVE